MNKSKNSLKRIKKSAAYIMVAIMAGTCLNLPANTMKVMAAEQGTIANSTFQTEYTYGDTINPTTEMFSINNSSAVPSFTWYLGDVTEGELDSTQALEAIPTDADTYTLVVSIEEDDNYSAAELRIKVVIEPKVPTAPTAPVISNDDITDTSVTITIPSPADENDTTKYEYLCIKSSDVTNEYNPAESTGWTESNIFNDLDANTAYTFYQRIAKVDDNTIESAPSGSTEVTTLKTDITNSAVVTVQGTYTYTGSAITPEAANVTVSVNDTNIDSSKYTFSASDNINAGTATITVTMNNDAEFTGSPTGTFTIDAATLADYTLPTASDIEYGETLADSELTGGSVSFNEQTVEGTWSFKNPNTKPDVNTEGALFEIVFTPGTNYNPIENVSVNVKINYGTAPNPPESTAAPTYGKDKTVADVSLPAGWSWNNEDATKALIVGTEVEATANYTADDADNYSAESKSVTIKIIMSDCPHSHKSTINAKTESCTSEGYTGDTWCSDCESVVTQGSKIPKKSHNLKKTAAVEPTCVSNGNIEYWTCSSCKKIYSDSKATTQVTNTKLTIDSKNHKSIDIKGDKAPTCSEEGYTGDTFCLDCRTTVSYGKPIDKIEHSPKTAVKENVEEATCTTAGSYNLVVYCSECDSVISSTHKVIPALGHKLTKTAAVAPTCKKKGNKEYWTCSVCDKIYSDSKATNETTKSKMTLRIDSDNHVNIVIRYAKAPTCVKYGYTGDTYCKDCGKQIDTGDIIKKLPVPAKGKTLTDTKTMAKYKVTKSGTKGGTVTYVKSTNSKATKVTIPSTVKIDGITYKVTAIGANAFKSNTKIKTLVIGSNIESIGKNAFYGAKNLKSVTIKTAKLTSKKLGSKSFSKLNSKAVIKVPSKQLKNYRTILKKAGITGKNQKITK